MKVIKNLQKLSSFIGNFLFFIPQNCDNFKILSIINIIIALTYNLLIAKECIGSYNYHYKGFTPNKGQLNTEEVMFYTRNGNLDIFITEKGLSYVIINQKNKKLARIDYELVGGKINKENIIYEEELPGYTNYYLGHCPEGILFVKNYKKVRIKSIYEGVDWIFRYDKRGNFHHEFEAINEKLAREIKIKVKYADIEIADGGKSIILTTPLGRIKDGDIIAYEGKKIIDVRYRITGEDVLSFDLENSNGNGKILIDPNALTWGSYYGGDTAEEARSITTDPSGNVFVIGSTFSINFPTESIGKNAYYQANNAGSTNRNNDVGTDVFIIKFSNSGVRKWATYYGGNNNDWGISIATDSRGNVFLTGTTYSNNFPTQNPGGGAYYQAQDGRWFGDAFIIKFNNSGIRQWATYYGGSYMDKGRSITTDINGNVFVTGTTESYNFPVQDPGGGAYFQAGLGGEFKYEDIFIVKFNNSGVRLWATYYGGSYDDYVNSITTDANGNVFVTGYTHSTDFPTYNPGGDAYFQAKTIGYNVFIIKFSNSGVRQWATYYGGNGDDYGLSITTDKSGNIFVTGHTCSTDFPTQDPGKGAYFQANNAGNYDIFIIKFSNSGVRLWATYYGGCRNEKATSITTDPSGNIFITGMTVSDNFPIQVAPEGAYFQASLAGGYDAFILKFHNSGERLFATYYGGCDHDHGSSITSDPMGNVFLTGITHSTNLPIHNPGKDAYFQPNNAGSDDIFVVKFNNLRSKKRTYLFWRKRKLE